MQEVLFSAITEIIIVILPFIEHLPRTRYYVMDL